MMEISIFIKKDGEEIVCDRKFDTYQDAIDFLDTMENKEIDKSHSHVMGEHK